VKSGSAVAEPELLAVYRLKFARELSDEDVETVLQNVRAFEKDHRPIMGRRGRGPFAIRYRDEIRSTSVGFRDRDRKVVMFRCHPMPGSTQYSTAVYVMAQMIAGKLKTEVDVTPETIEGVGSRPQN
jgi:hypothetical protein